MIDVFYSENEKPYVWASELHGALEIGTRLSTWFPRMVEYGFDENKDYVQQHKNVQLPNGRNNEVFDWMLTVDMAKEIAMIQRTPKGKEIRNFLLNLDKKVAEGEFLNNGQFAALFDICKVMGFFSVQKFFEREHFKKLFEGREYEWWNNRARLLGYTTKELKAALVEIGKKYHNREQAMFQIDRYNLIRMGVIDLFLALGKTAAYAQNVGNIAKTIAEQLKPEVYNDIDTLLNFKSDEQNKIITDLHTYTTGSKILQHFVKGRSTVNISPDYNQKDLFEKPEPLSDHNKNLIKALNYNPKDK